MEIVARDSEKRVLKQLLASKEPEFLAIYGRRRVGKTHLVREYCRNKGHYLEITGQKGASLKTQLANFMSAFEEAFSPGLPLRAPTSWREAFALLTQALDGLPRIRKKILFFDELPWLAGQRSGFLQSLDFFWNAKWSKRAEIKLIVCGSAASWVLEKLIHAKGGLHNRLTKVIRIKPFTLGESKQYLVHRGHEFSNRQVLQLYMVLGGVPYYLRQVEKGASVVENVDRLCFGDSAPLADEFGRLFHSLFSHAEVHEELIRISARKREGVSREYLLARSKLSGGGTFRKRLSELEAAGFVEIFVPFGRKNKEYFVKVIDEYALFYLQWIEATRRQRKAERYWQRQRQSAKWNVWAGYAFEAVCHKHLDQIIRALTLEGVAGQIGTWRYLPPPQSSRRGAQIDLLVDRSDDMLTICEIKFSAEPIRADKGLVLSITKKGDIFKEITRSTKQLNYALITASGLKPTAWSEDLPLAHVNLDALF